MSNSNFFMRRKPIVAGGVLPACCVLLAGTLVLGAAGANDAAVQPELVAPGIWRLHFGHPEAFTPTHFRSAPMDAAGLAKLPPAGSMPLNAADISFHVSRRGCSLLLPMSRQESVYGFGLSTRLFDMTQGKSGQTGRRVFLEPTDSPENELGESHAPVPFYVSPAGYGVFVDTARFASFYTGNDAPVGGAGEADEGGAQTSTAELYKARARRVKTMLVDVPAAPGVDVYVFGGPTMLDAVERYNLFSGGGALPPLWGLGVHYRGYTKYGADQTLALAARIRAEHIPCDVWGVEPGWQSRAYSCSFVWNTNQFPDPTGFIQKMHEQNFHMNFWEHAFMNPACPVYDEQKRWSGDYLVWNGLVPDFAAPQGRAVFLKQNTASLFSRGADGVKLDECDYQPDSAFPWSFPPSSIFPSGLDGEQMHSLFGVLYQQTMLAPYHEKGERTWGLVRNSQALAGPLPYVIYSDSYDPHCYVRGLANEGFSGLLWTPEVRDANSLEDLYRRIETVVFSGDAVINSWYISNPPWDQVDREKNNRGELMADRGAVTGNVRRLLELRMSFVPYLYAAFNEYRAIGKPPIRALVLDWPGDAKARQIDDEFMFGDSVLAAPMFAGEPRRTIYLPAGDWYNFWTREKISGGVTLAATNGVDQIPLFVKSGTLLPLAKPVEFIRADECFDVTVNLVGPGPAEFTLYEDDGLTDAFAKGAQNRVVLHADGSQHSAQRTGDYHGAERYKISGWETF